MTQEVLNTAIQNLHLREETYTIFGTMYHYVECKGRCTTEEAIDYILEDLGLDRGDTSLHMEALKYMIGYFITNYDELVLDEDAAYSECELKKHFASLMQSPALACFEAADNGGGDRFWNAYHQLAECQEVA